MRSLRTERAQSTAEFAVIVPLLLLFLFLIIDFGWLLKNWIVVTNSAREATRCATAHACEDTNGVAIAPDALATARLSAGITGNLVNTQVHLVSRHATPVRAGDSIIVCIQADNKYISPVPPMFSLVTANAVPNPLPVAARAEMRLEQDWDTGLWGNPDFTDGRCHF
jgi:TadE-like protein